MKRPRRQVWFVVFPQSELLDLSGPWAVLGYANEFAGQRLYDIRLVGAAAGEASTAYSGDREQ